MDIRPYRVSISEAAIATLKSKLEIADFPDELDEAAWDYGAPLADIKRLAQHWRERFDWQAFVDELNEQPHFEVGIPIDGFGELDVHFLHQKSSANRAIPLLFVHGCEFGFDAVWLKSYCREFCNSLTSTKGLAAILKSRRY